jgi:hypothetical protein
MTALEAAEKLLGFFRRGDAYDPETYVGGIAVVLSEFPPEIVKQVTRPGSDLACGDWMPTQGEVRKACREALGARYAAEARAREAQRRAAQIAARDALEARREANDKDRIARLAREFIAEAKVDLTGRRHPNDMTPAEAQAKIGTVPPVGPELAGDLARLMALPSLNRAGLRA